jgi:ATP-dependent protease Clp ATPase subunit
MSDPFYRASETRCSFCDRLRGEVACLIARPAAVICDECIGSCLSILADRDLSMADGIIERARAAVWPQSIAAWLADPT